MDNEIGIGQPEEIEEEQENPIYENIKKAFQEHWKPIVSITGAIILIIIVLLLIPKNVTLKVSVIESDSNDLIPAKINMYIDGELKQTINAESYPLTLTSVPAGKEIEFEVIPTNGLAKTTKQYTPTTDEVQNVKLVAYRNYNVNLEINPEKLTIGKGCSDQIIAKVTNGDPTPKQIQVYVPETGFNDDFILQNTDTRLIPIKVPKETEENTTDYEVKIKYTKISSKLQLTITNPGILEVDTEKITCAGEDLCERALKITNVGESDLLIDPIKKEGTIANYINFDDPTVVQNNFLLPAGASKTLFITVPTLAQGKRGTILITTSCSTQKEVTFEFN